VRLVRTTPAESSTISSMMTELYRAATDFPLSPIEGAFDRLLPAGISHFTFFAC
jgi:hypothetical protein